MFGRLSYFHDDVVPVTPLPDGSGAVPTGALGPQDTKSVAFAGNYQHAFWSRLFNELRARTAELGRSVDELRALNEVARAVSSTLDLRAVLSTVLTRSVDLAGADGGAIFRYSRVERAFHLVEAVGWDEAFARSVAAFVPMSVSGNSSGVMASAMVPEVEAASWFVSTMTATLSSG